MRRSIRSTPAGRRLASLAWCLAACAPLLAVGCNDAGDSASLLPAPPAAVDLDQPAAVPAAPCLAAVDDGVSPATDDDAHAAVAAEAPGERETLLDPCAATRPATASATYAPAAPPPPPSDTDAIALTKPAPSAALRVESPRPAPALWNGRGVRPVEPSASTASR